MDVTNESVGLVDRGDLPHSRPEGSTGWAHPEGPPAEARVRAARAAADLSREELGAAIGVSARTIRRLEDGQRRMSPSELRRIAVSCRVPEWFLAHGWRGWEQRADR